MTPTLLALAAPLTAWWLYWLTTRSTLLDNLEDAINGNHTVRGFITEGWECCLCRTHWTTALLLAASVASGLNPLHALLLWPTINGAHALVDELRNRHQDGPANTAGMAA